jgi:CBS domain-containing protein
MSLDRVARDETDLVTAAPGATVGELARLMQREGVGSVLVEEAEARPTGAIRRGPGRRADDDGSPAPVGVVTDRDLVVTVLAAEADPEARNAADVMTSNPVTVRSDDDLLACCRQLGQHHVRRAPIVDDAGSMVGIVTLDDVLRRLGDEIDAIGRVLDDLAAVTERTAERPEEP